MLQFPKENSGTFILDQTGDEICLYMINIQLDTVTTAPTAIDGASFTLASVTGAVVGDAINISTGGKKYQAIITAINSNVITTSTPCDIPIPVGALVRTGKWNANVNGSVTPQVFKIMPGVGAKWHINKIIVTMLDDSTMDDGKFGGITALTNGVLLRKVDGDIHNLSLITNNSGFREQGFEVTYIDKAPSGTYGVIMKKIYGGDDGSNTIIELDGDTYDELDFIVRDNLTGITKIAITVMGRLL